MLRGLSLALLFAAPSAAHAQTCVANGQACAVASSAPGTLPSYEGLVSNNLYAPHQIFSGNSMNARVPFYARDAITGPCRVRMPWYYLLNTTWESGTGLGAATVTFKLEYPAGTFTTVTFSGGAATGAMAAGGVVWSDYFTPAVPIPNGARGWFRSFVTTSGSNIILTNRGSSSGATSGGLSFGSGLTDQTGNAGFTPASVANAYGPDAFTCQTTKRTVLDWGDSREQDLSVYGDATYDYGLIVRSIGPKYAITSSAIAGGSMGASDASPAARANTYALAAYVSDAIVALGYNDRTTATATVDTYYQNLYSGLKAVNPNIRIGQTTIFSGTTTTVATGGLSSSGTTATVALTAAQAAQLWVGETVTIAGVTPSGYNGTVVITGISGSNVSYTLPAGGTGLAASTANGTFSDIGQSRDVHVFQTPAVSTSALATINNTTRQSRPQVSYYIEVADFFDAGRDTTYSKPNLLIDGVHPNRYGNQSFKSSGTVLNALPGN
jgi:hypothetical protein